MPPKRLPAADLKQVRSISIAGRASKVERGLLAKIPEPGVSVGRWLELLPDILKARDFRNIVAALDAAIRNERGVVWMMGAHPIKCGLTPLIGEMIRRRWITTLCFNGAGAIHDYEMATFGETSEDVEKGLADGTFGMVRETAEGIYGALEKFDGARAGFGQAVGRAILAQPGADPSLSLLATAAEHDCPATVHVALGTDIIHQHPQTDGALLGEASVTDFRILAGQLPNLGEGGVVVNLGSAVILPEVFLKALTVGRNLGNPVRNFTAVNFDMIQHYRSNTNVVRRPTSTGGAGYSITGHHELMMPLLFAALQEELHGG